MQVGRKNKGNEMKSNGRQVEERKVGTLGIKEDKFESKGIKGRTLKLGRPGTAG